jgi:hypothetical protein
LNKNDKQRQSQADKVISILPSFRSLISNLTTQEVAIIIGLIFIEQDDSKRAYEEFSDSLTSFMRRGYKKDE